MLSPACESCLASLQHNNLCSHVSRLTDAVWGFGLLCCAHLRGELALERPVLLRSRLLARVPLNLRVSPGPGLWLRDIIDADLRGRGEEWAGQHRLGSMT